MDNVSDEDCRDDQQPIRPSLCEMKPVGNASPTQLDASKDDFKPKELETSIAIHLEYERRLSLPTPKHSGACFDVMTSK